MQWTKDMLQAFHDLKATMTNICKLTIPLPTDTFILHTDASGAGIGATLNVTRDGKEVPVAFYGKQLQGAQRRYSATEFECLAIFKAIHHFAHFLFGSVLTDHRALVSLMKSRVLNRRLQGWMLQLQDYTFTILYRPGKENTDADAFSRQAWSSVEEPRHQHIEDECSLDRGSCGGPNPHMKRMQELWRERRMERRREKIKNKKRDE